MLRNLNRSYARGRVCGTPYVGVLGSEIPSTGDDGPGYVYNDLSLPADANKRFRGRIVAWPSAGDFYAYETTDFTFGSAPDGIYTAQYQLDEWDESGAKTSHDPETITLTVGNPNVTGTAAWTEANDTATGAGTVSVTGTGATTEANDSAAGSGALTVSSASATTEADDSTAAAGAAIVSGAAGVVESNDTATASGAVGGDGSITGSAAVTEADDAAAAQGVVCARAPRGSGYRRPFINSKRPRN